MKELIIEPQDKAPGIHLSSGKLLFHGRSIVESPKDFFEPAISWLKEYIKQPADRTVIIIKLEYVDAQSTQALFHIFKLAERIRKMGSDLHIKWYYAYGDIEMLELGEIIQGRLDIDFEFFEFEP